MVNKLIGQRVFSSFRFRLTCFAIDIRSSVSFRLCYFELYLNAHTHHANHTSNVGQPDGHVRYDQQSGRFEQQYHRIGQQASSARTVRHLRSTSASADDHNRHPESSESDRSSDVGRPVGRSDKATNFYCQKSDARDQFRSKSQQKQIGSLFSTAQKFHRKVVFTFVAARRPVLVWMLRSLDVHFDRGRRPTRNPCMNNVCLVSLFARI